MKFFNLKNPWMWASILVLISVIFGFVFKFTGAHWAYVTALIPWIPLGLFIVVGVIFAWIINPIRRLIKKIKDKKNNVVD